MKKSKNLVNILTVHKLAIYIGLLLAIIITLPYIYGYLKFGDNFSPLISNENLSYIREETYSYSAQVNQTTKGHLFGDAYIWEYRNLPSPFVGELAGVIPIAISSIAINSVPYGFFIAKLILAPMLLLLIYYSLQKLKYSRPFSILASISVIVIPFLSTLMPYLSHQDTLLTGAINSPLLFFRTINPLSTSIYLFLALFSTILVLRNSSSRLFYFWPVVIGITFYSTTFIWTTVSLALFILAPSLLKSISKRKLIISILIFITITLPYFINFVLASEFFDTKGFLLTFSYKPEIMFPAQVRYILIALLFVWYSRKSHFSKVVFAFILSASILMDLHQVVISRNVQADHYISRIMAPIATLSIFIIIYERFVFLKKNGLIWIILTVIILAVGFNQQLSWIKHYQDDFKQLSYRKNITDYISKNTNKNDVIGTLDPDINDEIQANTGRWVYIAPGDRTFVAHNEQLTRICDLAILLNKNESNPEVKRAVYYSLALESRNENKVNSSVNLVRDCIRQKEKAPHYKINYLISNIDESTNWEIIKIN